MPFSTDTYIRRAERDDLDTIVQWMESPDFQRFLYGDPARSPRQIRAQIVAMLGRAAGHTMPGGLYLMIDSKKDGPIGLVSLQNVSWRNRSCNIDVYIGNEKLRSRVAIVISIFRALEYCFDELNLHRITAFIYAFNRASWRIFEMTGAKREVTLEKHVPRDGELRDMYVYGLLRSDFDAVRAKYPKRAGGDFSLRAMVEAIDRDLAEPAT